MDELIESSLDTLRVCLSTPFKAKSVIIEGTT